MQVLKAVNLLFAFLLELCMVAAFAFWGFNTGWVGYMQIGLGVGVPLIVVFIWGYWMAPNSRRRLTGNAYLALKVVLIGLAAAALFFAGQPTLSAVLGIIFIANQALIYVWNQ